MRENAKKIGKTIGWVLIPLAGMALMLGLILALATVVGA